VGVGEYEVKTPTQHHRARKKRGCKGNENRALERCAMRIQRWKKAQKEKNSLKRGIRVWCTSEPQRGEAFDSLLLSRQRAEYERNDD
jgi:hypothetical protein